MSYKIFVFFEFFVFFGFSVFPYGRITLSFFFEYIFHLIHVKNKLFDTN